MTTVFLLIANGDDYHGTFPVKAFTNKEKADKAKEGADKNQECCEQCGHKYVHTVHSIELE